MKLTSRLLEVFLREVSGDDRCAWPPSDAVVVSPRCQERHESPVRDDGRAHFARVIEAPHGYTNHKIALNCAEVDESARRVG